MLIVAAMVLLISHGLPWILFPRSRLALSPSKLVAAVSSIMTLPYFMILVIQPELSAIQRFAGHEMQHLLVVFAIYYSLGLLATFFGIRLSVGARVEHGGLGNRSRVEGQMYGRLAIWFFVISVVFIFLKFSAAGGFFFFVTNIAHRTENLAGTAIYDVIITPTVYLTVFFGLYARRITGWPPMSVLVVAVTILFVLLAMFGGRKAPILLLVFSMLAASAFGDRVKWLSIKFVALYAFVVFFFAAALQFRLISQMGSDATELAFIDIVRNLSYVDTYLFIVHYFTSHDFWYGASFVDLIDRIAGIYYLPGHPPIDDGMYIQTLYQGGDVRPPEAMVNLYPSSWPPETFGSGFLNFGLLGVMGFSFARGLLIGGSFRFAKSQGFAPMSLFIFMYLALTFHVSNLRIVQTGLFLGGVGLFAIGVDALRALRKKFPRDRLPVDVKGGE